MSDNSGIEQSGWPLTAADRHWTQRQLFVVLLVAAAATWCYVIGEYVGYYLNLKMGFAAMTAGSMIGMLLVTLSVVPVATRYGIDSIAAAKPQFGNRGWIITVFLQYASIIGWNSFWCRSLDAVGTKAVGAGMLFACLSAFLGLVFGTLEDSGKSFRAGGYAGEFLANEMSEYLNRTGAVIVVLTLIVLSTILSTQFSFGRFFAALTEGVTGSASRGVEALNAWREERRRDKQRRGGARDIFHAGSLDETASLPQSGGTTQAGQAGRQEP